MASHQTQLSSPNNFSADLDLLIISDEGLPLAATADLRDAFSESDLPFKVDLVLWSALNKNFKQTFEQNHVVIQNVSH